ncbi:hypothetical protein IP79_05075 [Porphyrobacter sp. AAP60]|nr:hypothetical protein IP79_05075 [Porphyrobacter sp. AAP60]
MITLALPLLTAALMAGFGWMGFRRKWIAAGLLSLPFFGLAVWLEVSTAGPPLHESNFGILMLFFVFGPLVAAWLAFVCAAVISFFRSSKTVSEPGD